MSVLKCVACGQHVRKNWLRCPRCRVLLSEQVPVEEGSESSTPRSSSSAGWVLLLGLAGVLVMIGWAVTRSELPPATLAAAASDRSVVRPLVRTDRSAAGDGQAAREGAPEFEALDSMRAGTAAYAAGDLVGALAQYEAAVEAAPDDPEARNNLAQVLVRQGRPQDALVHFEQAVRLDPQKWAYRFNRARAFGQVDRWNDAARDYRAAWQLFPEDYATVYNLGLALMRLKQYPEAAQTLAQAVEMAPGEASFLITLGTAYVGAEQHDQARTTFERFLAQFPGDPEAAKVKQLLQAMSEASQSQN